MIRALLASQRGAARVFRPVGLALFLAGCAEYERPITWRDDVSVHAYDVSLRVDFSGRMLVSETTVRLVYDGEDEIIDGRFAGGVIDSIRVNGISATYRQGGERIRIWLPEGPDTLELSFFYTVRPPRGAYFGGPARPPLVFTDSWPERMTGWLPVFDHPAAPVRPRFRVTVPGDHIAVANGRLVSETRRADETTFEYELDARVPLYAVALVAGALHTDTLRQHGHTCISYASPAERRGRALQDACGAVAFFDSLLAPYPFPQYGVVSVPMRQLGMENAGLAFVRSDVFSGSPGPSFFEKPEAVQVHEAAHQWFGNSVMIREWSDLWISEAVSTYLTLLYFEQRYGRESFLEGLAELSRADPRRRGRVLPVVRPAVRNPEDHLHTGVYRRGASALHLLRLQTGEERFIETLRRVYRRFAGTNVSTEEMIETLTAFTQPETEDLLRFWLYGDRTPVLHAEWESATRTLSWNITGDEGTLSGIPLEMLIRSGAREMNVSADRGRISLVGWGPERPDILLYGVPLEVQ